ncbi:hypothetical protein THRCLA_20486 [Thraustotheca clavata]|uniref:Uncharacterized protein n=1 Tax=Thraustotheca clavata TaxID=74557 RepID=A0A1W0A6N3_9STRA|nr:hypothetical protein THRCLA_20486 [Thraustotheca clavata]
MYCDLTRSDRNEWRKELRKNTGVVVDDLTAGPLLNISTSPVSSFLSEDRPDVRGLEIGTEVARGGSLSAGFGGVLAAALRKSSNRWALDCPGMVELYGGFS